MRVLLQRVKEARVTVAGKIVGQIGKVAPGGLLALVGIGKSDTEADLDPMVRKILNLRIFEDNEGKMNRSLLDIGGEILAVSQFTLYADCRKGRRPSFIGAADPESGRELFDQWVEKLRAAGTHVETGEFGAMMEVSLINDGPVTIWLDSEELFSAQGGPSRERVSPVD